MVEKHRKHNRLKGYDYSSSGYYFVTICTKDRTEYFGNIIDNKITLNNIGEIIKSCWLEIPNHFPSVELDEFQIMQNHIHGIIIIVGAIFKSPIKSPNVSGEINFAPTRNITLSNIIKWFKSISSMNIRKTIYSFQWQKSYYDNIICNEKSLYYIRQYIRDNPMNWNEDRNNLL